MTKLTNFKGRNIGAPPSRFSSAPRDEAQRSRIRRQDPVFKLYGASRWKKLRESILVRDKYTCAKCGSIAYGKGEAVVDHIKPHRRDETLFWDPSNLQVLCKSPCHDAAKQREEQRAIRGVWY